MNAIPMSMVSRPGTSTGPCALDCYHDGCRSQKKEARSLCMDCRKAIGFDRSFRRGEDGPRHAVCADE